MAEKITHSVIALGSFDGVHLGHQYLLRQLINTAEREHLRPVIVTFFPHPSHILTPEHPLKLINTIDERVELIKSHGVDTVYVQEFTKVFARLTAKDFVLNTLVKKLNMDTLILGHDHSFGRNKEGDFDYLVALGHQYGFKVQQLKPYYQNNLLINSTHLRQVIEQGAFSEVNTLLGYEFSLFGKVIQGNQLGRKIGFNTANIALDYSNKITPKKGVYIVHSKIGDRNYYGMMNIGFRPTIDGKTQTIEVHFFDLNKDLYYQKIKVCVLHRLRDEFKFDSIDALRKQLEKDKQESLDWIKNH